METSGDTGESSDQVLKLPVDTFSQTPGEHPVPCFSKPDHASEAWHWPGSPRPIALFRSLSPSLSSHDASSPHSSVKQAQSHDGLQSHYFRDARAQNTC